MRKDFSLTKRFFRTLLEPEVALIDIGLPGFDGYEVARRIQASVAGDRTVLVALTGYAQHEDRLKADSAGFDGYLVSWSIRAD